MALDGITISNIVYELNNEILGGRIDKIYQPLKDEIIFSVRTTTKKNYKILVSANSNQPRVHITNIQKENPISAPMFCMVMRKYVSGGKIVEILQPNFERIINIKIESINEMGDMTVKTLIIEMMGKHSNIILIDENEIILDSIKRVSHATSSVREVLPGKKYVLPPSQNKINPLLVTKEDFIKEFLKKDGEKLQSFIYKTYTGISPIVASEICCRAGYDSSIWCGEIEYSDKLKLYNSFFEVINKIKEHLYNPHIIYDKNEKIIDFSVINMKQFSLFKTTKFGSVSELLEEFYTERDNIYHVQQKAHDMRRVVLSNIERCVKKKEIQNKTLKDIANKDIWKLKGELITSNIYLIKKGDLKFRTVNFYDENMPEIEIALDSSMTPSENAQRYFNKYNKAKRTLAAMKIQKKQNDEELSYLESILNSLENSKDDADLSEIRQELIESGFMKRKNIKKNKGQKMKKSKPLHYISSEGYHIYIGKSNIQNDELTLKFAQINDIWLHTKNIPGSHVIIKTNGEKIPDNTILEAANLAAYNSKAKTGSNIPVDYTIRKNVKKPSGAKPGLVIYDKNKTIYVTPDNNKIKELKQVDN